MAEVCKRALIEGKVQGVWYQRLNPGTSSQIR